ncbi:MAG: putative porin [Bacteroidales bacterium]|nr:putative porin [Bacteroidales bacterium]
MRGKRILTILTCAIIALLPFMSGPASGRERSPYFRMLQDTLLNRAAARDTTVRDSVAAGKVAADSVSRDTVPALDSATLAAMADSLRRQNLYDSLDNVFWGQLDTMTLPCLDSLTTAYYDSVALRLPDTSDIKRLKRKLRREERDSIKAERPRVLETFVVPDSVYYRRILVWNSDAKFNEWHEKGLDTTANSNFYEQPMMKKDISGTSLGTSGSATLYHNWFRREETPDAPMFTPYIGDSETDETVLQYNTKTPYTELAYWGTPFANKKMEESNLKLLSTQNITPSFNFTLGYRRLGSRGMLMNEETDHRTTTIIGNYIGKRYFANFGTVRQRVIRNENGGIRDSFWIRDTSVESKSIEVTLNKAANTYKRRSWFIHQSLAVPMNFFRKDRDSLALGEGTMAHLGHSGEFTTYSKIYTDQIALDDTVARGFYHNNFHLDETNSSDEMAVRNFENRFYIKLQPFAPDAMLAKVNAGIGYQILSTYAFDPKDYLTGRKYSTQHNLYVYGGASGQLRKYLAWNADADYYYAGARMFDFDINANLRLSVYPIDKGIHLTGKFHAGLRTPHPFEQHIVMNHHQWDNDFGKVSKNTLEAELSIPKWRLDASFGYALVANMMYYDSTAVIRQHAAPVSIMSAYLHKDFTLWRLHFDNQALFQISSAEDVLPLPKLTLNLRWYFDIDVVKDVMNMQIGVNGIANTAWYAPSYSPDIGQFHLQTRELIGNVPYFDIFANIQWKQACIYVKYTNAFLGWPSTDYFSAYHYIKPGTGFKFGILWPFYVW